MTKTIWTLIVAVTALAAAAPASAQSASFRNGPGRHFHAPGRAFSGHPGIGMHRDPCARLGLDCSGRSDLVGEGLLGWGGGLIEDPEYAARDQGFFSGPAEVQADGGSAYYDYDRAYPYDWYREPGAAARAEPIMAAAPAVRCDVAWVGGRGGARSPVRVCRGR